MPDCRYMVGGECRNRLALPLYGHCPSEGTCADCEHRNGLRGLGDALAWILSWTPAKRLQRKGCGACGRRQERLNQIAPRPQARNCGKCGKSVQVP